MVYSNGYVLSVIYQGNILSENKANAVQLPFGAEYGLRLRNKNSRRAVAQIYIDDKNVSADGYVIPANDYVDIERFIEPAKKFKFVSETSYAAAQAGKGPREDGANGVIRVVFRLEKERKPVTNAIVTSSWIYPNYQPYGYGHTGQHVNTTPRGVTGQSAGTWNSAEIVKTGSITPDQAIVEPAVSVNCCSFVPETPKKLAGVTVEGGYSNQKFRAVHVDLESEETVIVLQLVEGPIKDPNIKVYCEKCGTKRPETANFCGTCGLRF